MWTVHIDPVRMCFYFNDSRKLFSMVIYQMSKDAGQMVDGPLFRRDATPAMESMEDSTSVDLDVQSEASETTTVS